VPTECNDHPTAFQTDGAKVNFALSYLKGIALASFEPYLLESPEIDTYPPDFMSDYGEFCVELQNNFRPLDPKGSAESELENLAMKDNQRIVKYIVNFNPLAMQTGWVIAALRHSFYRGLLDRLKDQLVQVKKPRDLYDLKDKAQLLDARYWERKSEVSRASGSSSAKASLETKSSTDKASERKSPVKATNSSSSSSSPKTPPVYANTLGKDGKLKPMKRQRHIDNKLCIICGGAGHMAKDCSKAKYTSSCIAACAASTPSMHPIL
jgi:Retrotransposon gag protein